VNKVNALEQAIKEMFENDGSGHDWWHIHRVRNNALALQKEEGGDKELIEIAALVHDIGDHKFTDDEKAPQKQITKLMMELEFDIGFIRKVLDIVEQVSFKGAGVETLANSKEAQVVQDADRLDAIGAIGIARAFAFGGNRNRLMYHPDQSPTLHENFDEYKNDKGHTINHFYEKLLLLKDRMQTSTAKKIAQERHDYMDDFLKQFYKEWNIE